MINYKWLEVFESQYFNDATFVFIAVPSLEELESFIKEYMITVDRCLELHSGLLY